MLISLINLLLLKPKRFIQEKISIKIIILISISISLMGCAYNDCSIYPDLMDRSRLNDFVYDPLSNSRLVFSCETY
jgi:hypothetical protein